MLGFTLSRQDFREYDQQIRFYTKEAGKVETVARGVKKIVSRNAPALEPFALLDIELAEGRGLTYVKRAQVVESFRGLRSDLKKLLVCSYCIHLVDAATQPGEKDEKIFYLLYKFLKRADTMAVVDTSIAYEFIYQFLTALGYAPLAQKIADSTIISYAEHHLNRKVPDIANLMLKLYNFHQ